MEFGSLLGRLLVTILSSLRSALVSDIGWSPVRKTRRKVVPPSKTRRVSGGNCLTPACYGQEGWTSGNPFCLWWLFHRGSWWWLQPHWPGPPSWQVSCTLQASSHWTFPTLGTRYCLLLGPFSLRHHGFQDVDYILQDQPGFILKSKLFLPCYAAPSLSAFRGESCLFWRSLADRY